MNANKFIESIVDAHGYKFVTEVIKRLPERSRAIATVYVDELLVTRMGPQEQTAEIFQVSKQRVNKVVRELRKELELVSNSIGE